MRLPSGHLREIDHPRGTVESHHPSGANAGVSHRVPTRTATDIQDRQAWLAFESPEYVASLVHPPAEDPVDYARERPLSIIDAIESQGVVGEESSDLFCLFQSVKTSHIGAKLNSDSNVRTRCSCRDRLNACDQRVSSPTGTEMVLNSPGSSSCGWR